MKRLAVISSRESELSRLLEQYFPGFVQMIRPGEVENYDLGHYSSIAVLGGTGEEPLLLEAAARIALEREIEAGKRVFCEFVQSAGEVYSEQPVSTRFWRLVSTGGEIAGLTPGALLEEQCNQFIAPYFSRKQAVPLLLYQEAADAHDCVTLAPEAVDDIRKWALWEERPNLLLAAFRLCEPVAARFSPFARWDALFAWLLQWLGCEAPANFQLKRPYSLAGERASREEALEEAVAAAVRWFDRAGILLANGAKGVAEGFGTEISPDGLQKRVNSVRTDCSGEAALLFLADYLHTGNPVSLEKSDRLERFCFERMQVSEGEFRGMLRWTDAAWEVCYQDDAARVLIPSLLKSMLLGRREYLPHCCAALEFLQATTGTDGLRPSRTDNLTLDSAMREQLASAPANFPCAHYNAYYAAALLLAGEAAGRTDFRETGIRCMESLMAVYPHTIREQSETEEQCRLLLPLACLYGVTGEPRHREWLDRVAEDLRAVRHPGGAYLEWDSDYSAACSKKSGGECSLLTKNGDPVVDLLYSNNWLPLGFLFAWLVTGEERYRADWEEICRFLARIQLRSASPEIHGAWARGFDADREEVYGLPNDVGWGPWAVESGWTVAEIAAGMALGLSGRNPFTELRQRKTDG